MYATAAVITVGEDSTLLALADEFVPDQTGLVVLGSVGKVDGGISESIGAPRRGGPSQSPACFLVISLARNECVA